MSNFKGHLIAGSISSVALAAGSYYLTGDVLLSTSWGSCVFIGSLAPDIDTGSIPSRIFAISGIIISAFLLYIGMTREAALIGIVYMAFSSDKHRGFTHGWMLIIATMCLGILGAYGKIHIFYSLLAPFSFGLIVHKVMDR